MEIEDKEKIYKALERCASIINMDMSNPAMQKLLERLYGFKDISTSMDSLALTVHNALAKNPEKYREAMDALKEAEPERTNLEEILQYNLDHNYVPGNIPIEENHRLIEDTLKKVCDRLNEKGIDYYVVGALSVYLKTHTELFRYHGDIDFLIPEDRIEDVAEALKDTDYVFSDDRFDNKRTYTEEVGHAQGEHEVIANHKDNEFHLGFFLYRREKDGAITIREYFMGKDPETGKKVPMVLERYLSKELSELEYSNEETEFAGTRFRTSTPESVMLKKMYTRHSKDLKDITALEGKIDPEKMETLRGMHSTQAVVPVTVPMDKITESALETSVRDSEVAEAKTEEVSKDVTNSKKPEDETK